jgi:Protein of unknown function (DUF2771)
VLPLLAAAVGLTVAGCDKPVPSVSFFSSGQTASTLPTQYCDTGLTSCEQDGGAAASLRVPAGDPLQVSVPGDVADSTWLIAFKYKDANGQETQGRTSVFADGAQYAYTLRLPSPTDQLELVQVQRIGGITQDATGDIQYVSSGVWALNASN